MSEPFDFDTNPDHAMAVTLLGDAIGGRGRVKQAP